MDQFMGFHVTEDGFDLVAGLARQLARFISAIVNQAFGHWRTLFIHAHHHIAAFETALYVANAHCQQA